MKCPKCDKEIKDNIQICPHCGYDLESQISTQDVTVKTDETEDTVEPEAFQSTEVLDTIKKTWKSIVGNEDIGQTIKESADEVKAPSQISIRQTNIVDSKDLPVEPPPDYEIIEKIGEGGMGVIYTARQAAMDRVVVVKMVKGEQDQRKKDILLSEGVALGNLDHPNILPAYDLGSNKEGQLFYSMKRVTGTGWDEVIKDKTRQENLDILMRVCDAVAFAHSRGVIHRDLKPENVMLGEYGEVYVMDWGLAASVTEEGKAQPLDENSSSGGTPAYMAPEMGGGEMDKIGIRSDVYLLGAILFEIVTGKMPHTGRSVYQCLYNVIENNIVKTEEKGELIDIALKAMATSPDERYQSVQQFQNVIRDYQSHAESLLLTETAKKTLNEAGDDYKKYNRAIAGFEQAIELWKENKEAWEELIKAQYTYAETALKHDDLDLAEALLDKESTEHEELFNRIKTAQQERLKRRKRVRTLTYSSIGLAAVIIIVLTIGFFWIRSENKRAVKAEQLALERKQEAEDAREAEKKAKEKAIEAKEIAERAQFAEKQAKEKAIETREAEAIQRQKAEAESENAIYESYVAKIQLARIKIEEHSYLEADKLLNSCSPKHRNWEWGRLKYLCNLDLLTLRVDEGCVYGVVISPDGKTIITAGSDHTVKIWDLETCQKIQTLAGHLGKILILGISPDGKRIVTGSEDKTAKVWNLEDGTILHSFEDFSKTVSAVSFSSDGNLILIASYDNSIRVMNSRTYETVFELDKDKGCTSPAVLSPDSKSIFARCGDKRGKIWDIKSGNEVVAIDGHASFIYDLSYSPDGKMIVTASADKSVRIWDAETGEVIKTINPGLRAKTVIFASDSKRILVGGYDNTVRLIDVETGNELSVLKGHSSTVMSVAFSPDDNQVISGSADGTVKLWDLQQAKSDYNFKSFDPRGNATSITPDGTRIVFARREDNSVEIWNIYNESKELELEDHANVVLATSFSSDGKLVVAGGEQTFAKVWDANTGEELLELNDGDPMGVYSTAFSSDNMLIATGGINGVIIWDAQTGELINWKTCRSNRLVTFSPKDSNVLSVHSENTILLWKAKTGRELLNLKGQSASFSPNGDKIIISLKNVIQIWDIKSDKVIREFNIGRLHAYKISYSRDGKRVFVATKDNILIYDTEHWREIYTLKSKYSSMAFSSDGQILKTSQFASSTIWPALDWTKTSEELEQEKLEAWRARWKKD